MTCVEESIKERDNKEFEKGLDSKVELAMYKIFGENIDYLHGVGDAETRLLFKFRSGMHGLNEGIEREKVHNVCCVMLSVSVAHVLWDCPAYRKSFMEELSHLLGSKFSQFLSLDSVEKTSFIMGSELWEENFSALLSLVKRFIVDVWEVRKIKLYGNDSCPSKLLSQHSAENLAGTKGKFKGKSLLHANVNKGNVNMIKSYW